LARVDSRLYAFLAATPHLVIVDITDSRTPQRSVWRLPGDIVGARHVRSRRPTLRMSVGRWSHGVGHRWGHAWRVAREPSASRRGGHQGWSGAQRVLVP
jgi:hypothetical protein